MDTQKKKQPDFKCSPASTVKGKKDISLKIIILLFILLWSYTATSKLIDVNTFKTELYNQNFSRHLADLIFWFIPASEFLAASLLAFTKSHRLGLLLSVFLMTLFTWYTGLVILGYYDHVPCSCAGVFQLMDWQTHFLFNISFLLLSLWSTYYHYERSKQKCKTVKKIR